MNFYNQYVPAFSTPLLSITEWMLVQNYRLVYNLYKQQSDRGNGDDAHAIRSESDE